MCSQISSFANLPQIRLQDSVLTGHITKLPGRLGQWIYCSLSSWPILAFFKNHDTSCLGHLEGKEGESNPGLEREVGKEKRRRRRRKGEDRKTERGERQSELLCSSGEDLNPSPELSAKACRDTSFPVLCKGLWLGMWCAQRAGPLPWAGSASLIPQINY